MNQDISSKLSEVIKGLSKLTIEYGIEYRYSLNYRMGVRFHPKHLNRYSIDFTLSKNDYYVKESITSERFNSFTEEDLKRFPKALVINFVAEHLRAIQESYI